MDSRFHGNDSTYDGEVELSVSELEKIETILEAQWVIPVEPHGAVFNQYAVALAGACIADVLPIADARSKYPNAQRIELPNHALIPGLVNAHTHNPMTLMRGVADDLPLMTWLQDHIWPTEAKLLGPEFIHDGTVLAVAEMLRGGTTCCNENYFFPDIIAATYRRLGFRAMVGLPILEFPSAWARAADEYIGKGLAVHDEFKGESLISTCLAPHAPYTVSDDSFKRIHILADQLDIPVHLHLHETANEIEESRRLHGVRPLARLHGLGLINSQLIAVHMTQLTEGEIGLCAENGVSVVHCPESNLKLASGFCPAEALRRAHVNVALGTDGCASNNDLDMFGEMRTAALLAKGVAADPSAWDAASTLRAATLNGAKALGWEGRIGSIEVGKQADLSAIRLNVPETQPIYNVISQLIYSCGRHQVSDVWISGQRKLCDGALVGLDLAEVSVLAERWQSRIAHL